nr:hypothetical protein [uncultured Chitinophaga sp.]
MKIERLISCFDKENEELLQEYNIDFVDINVLKSIFKPSTDDPLMYNPYPIGPKEAEELKAYIDIDINFDKNLYQLDCFQS